MQTQIQTQRQIKTQSQTRPVSYEFGDPVFAQAPATCGELVQGYLHDSPFLVNSPIALYARVKIQLNRVGGVCVFSKGIYSKAAYAICKTLAKLDALHLGADFEVLSNIPRGKGLASSTSEVAACVHATAKALGHRLSPVDMAEIAVSKDASDGVYFPGISMCNQLSGALLEVLGEPPPLAFVIVDTGGSVDSVGFDRERARHHAKVNEAGLRDALSLVQKGFTLQEPSLIAAAATLSAEINQGLLYKAEFSDLLMATKEVGALGVNCAHTGTVLGVMFDPRNADQEKIIRRVEDVVGSKRIIGCYRLISGGVQ